MDETGCNIAAERVGAKRQALERERGNERPSDHAPGRLRVQIRGDEGKQDQDEKEREPDHGATVAREALQEAHHAASIRGSAIRYRRSVMMLNTTTIADETKNTPSSTE